MLLVSTSCRTNVKIKRYSLKCLQYSNQKLLNLIVSYYLFMHVFTLCWQLFFISWVEAMKSQIYLLKTIQNLSTRIIAGLYIPSWLFYFQLRKPPDLAHSFIILVPSFPFRNELSKKCLYVQFYIQFWRVRAWFYFSASTQLSHPSLSFSTHSINGFSIPHSQKKKEPAQGAGAIIN